MPILKEVCTKCGEDRDGCKCELFHPNRLELVEKRSSYLLVNREEAWALNKFFMECGYISHEHYPKIHEFIDGKLSPFLKDK